MMLTALDEITQAVTVFFIRVRTHRCSDGLNKFRHTQGPGI